MGDTNTFTRRINIYVDSGQAQVAYDKLVAQQQNLTKKISEYTAKGKEIPEKLTKQLNDVTAAMDRQAKKISGQLTPSFRDLQQTAQRVNNELKRMSEQDPGFAKKKAQAEAATKAYLDYAKSINSVKTGLQQTLTGAKGSFLETVVGTASGFGIVASASAAFGVLKDFLKSSFEEANQAEESLSRLKLALENVGRVDALNKLTEEAARLARQFSYLDNDDIVEAQAKLVTYGKLSINQIKQLTPVIIDYAAKSRQSIEAATEDIIRGLSGQGRSLKQYGVDLEKGGTFAENFGTIMTVLAEKVKNSGEEFQKTGAGGIAYLKQQLNDIEESFGNVLAPAVAKSIAVLKEFSDLISNSATYGGGGIIEKSLLAPFRAIYNVTLFIFRAWQGMAGVFVGVYGAAKKLGEVFDGLGQTVKGAVTLSAEDRTAGIEKMKKAGSEIAGAYLAGYRSVMDSAKIKAPESTGDDNSALNFSMLLTPEQKRQLKEEEQERNRISDERVKEEERIATLIKKLRQELYLDSLEGMTKEIAAVRIKYDELRALAKGHSEAIKQIRVNEAVEIGNILEKYPIDFEKAQQAILKIGEDTKTNIEDVVPDPKAPDAWEQAWREAMDKVQKDFEDWAPVAQQAINFVSTIFEAINQKENAELAADRKRNAEKAKNLKKRLDNDQILRKEYDVAIAKMDKEQEAKHKEIERRQFERNKAIQITQTIINTAAAVVSALGTSGNIYAGIALAAVAAATGAAQIAVIASSEPASYGAGGIFKGDKHSDSTGGNPVIDPTTGRTIAKVEEGEAFIPADTTAANRSTINWMLRNRGKRLNIERATENIQYAMGGIFGRADRGKPRISTNLSDEGDGSDPMMISGQVATELRQMRAALTNLKVYHVKDDQQLFEQNQKLIFTKSL